MVSDPDLQPEGGTKLRGRRSGDQAAVLAGVEAAGDGRDLARAGERVGAVGEPVMPSRSASAWLVTTRRARNGGWADVGNLHVASPYRHRGVGSWLLGQAAGWLRLAGVSRLLNYAWLEGTDPGGLNYDDYRAFLAAVGFRELTRTARGWIRQ